MEMRIPTRGLGSAGLPPISTDDSFTRSRGSRRSPPSVSLPMAMSIPNSNSYDEPPPPLPPPRFVPVDGPTVFDPRSRDHDDGFLNDERDGYKSRSRSYRPDLDEGYHSIGSSARTLNSPRFSMHNDYQYQRSFEAYDNSMLNKLNARRPMDNHSPTQWTALSSSARDKSNRPTPMQLPRLLSLPDRTRLDQPMLESPHRYTQTPLSSAASPRSNLFRQGPSHMGDYRSPLSAESADSEQSPYPRSGRGESIPDDATVSTQGSYEMRDDDVDFPMDETSRLHRLNIQDAYREKPGDRGQKRRRAPSPQDEDVVSLQNDMFRRRELISRVNRGSPTPRLTAMPQSSISSISSAGRSVTSYTSMTTASSLTSVGSFDRRSPNGPSPVSPADTAVYDTPYPGSLSSLSGLSRRLSNSIGDVQQQHQRTLSDLSSAMQANRALASPRRLEDLPKSSCSSLAAKMQGRILMCECCPKKPKKFDTREELSAHEAEKQYECSFCGNRFKNKNEMERHQNSLHVRRHSWSCSALTGYERVFHDSTTAPGDADVCGYCGEEFARTGFSTSTGRSLTDADWEARIRHLQDIHKFRECNSSKKFFRADHFRQHLKHSHAGTSGKWTNMLENACMLEAEPPTPSR